jgi:SNF2 family DNA or RNA helicase
MSPPDVDLIVALQELASTMYDPRRREYIFSLWDLPAAEKVATMYGYRFEYDDALNAMLNGWTKHRMELEFIRKFGENDPLEVPGLKLPLRPFQRVGVMYLTAAKKAILGDQPGTGKTPQTIATYLLALSRIDPAMKALILCPSSLVDTAWRKNFRKFSDIEPTIVRGTLKEREIIYNQSPQVLVVSYAYFLRDKELIAKHHRVKFMGMDEAQRVTSEDAKTTNAVIDYIDDVNPSFMIPITGTPVNNWPDDLWALMRMISPRLSGTSRSFKKRYVVKKPVWRRNPKTGKAEPVVKEYGSGRDGKPKRMFQVKRVAGYKNLDELRDKFAPFIIRRLKSEVLKDLPPVTHEQYDIDLSAHEREVYETMKKDFLLAMVSDDESEGAAFQWLMRAQQIADSLEIFNGERVSSKLAAVKEFIRDNAEEHKIVLFSRFKEMTDILVREFSDLDPAYYHGEIPQDKRDPIAERFQNDPTQRLFVGTLKAGGEGLDLFKADIVAFYDRWWSPTAQDQAIGRLDRMGQENPVLAVSFVVRDSIEERIMALIQEKRELIAHVLKDEDVIKRLSKKVLRGLI